MTTEFKINNSEMTVLIAGSLDTLTAPELDKQLNEKWHGISKLILNFDKVDYVSSAGLRVILAADKHMAKAGEMILQNVNDDVKEVFEMTGFDELLTFE